MCQNENMPKPTPESTRGTQIFRDDPEELLDIFGVSGTVFTIIQGVTQFS